MFLNAQARLRHDAAKNQMWDKKIGIWPVGDEIRLKAGKNKGNLKWKDKNIDSQVYSLKLMTEVVKSIAKQWPCKD